MQAQLGLPAARGDSWGPPLPAPCLGAPQQHHPILQRPYDSHYAILRHGHCFFTIRVRARDEIIFVSRLKPCMHAKPNHAVCTNHPAPTRWPSWPLPAAAVHPRLGGSRFQTPWSLHHHTRSSREYACELFSHYPAEGFCTPRASCFLPASTAAPAETISKD